MDKKELERTLNKLGIPGDSYSLGDVKNEALCMIPDGFIWCVFYSERGHRTEPEYFSSENDACDAFLSRIRKWF